MTYTGTKEIYRKYIDRVRAFHEKRKRRPLRMLKGLQDYMNNYAHLASALEFGKASKAHIIGLSSCMSSLLASESALGLFSDAFEKVTQQIAKGIISLTMKNPQAAADQLAKWWLQLTILMSAGLVELARQQMVPMKKETPYDPQFRDELILTLLFYSEYPKLCFREMGEALNIEKRKIPLFSACYEAIALLMALTACSKEISELRAEWIDSIRLKLESAVEMLIEALDSEESNEEAQSKRALLEQLRIALQRNDIEGVAQIWIDLLEECGYKRDLFQKDLQAIKGLFFRLKEAYLASKENKSILMHLVG